MISIQLAISGSWVNVNSTKSASNLYHIHDGILSGVFYLKVPEKSGNIIFKNSNINPLWEGFRFIEQRNDVTGEFITITPTEGEIIIWPSYIYHGVLPNEHNNERISVAFNISAIPLLKNDD